MVVMNSMVGVSDNCETTDNDLSSGSILEQLDQFLYIASTAITDSSASCGGGGLSTDGLNGAAAELTAEEVATSATAMRLLQHLPTARPAALAYLAHLLAKMVARYMRGGGGGGSGSSGGSGDTSTILVVRVEEVLRTLVENEEVDGDGGGLWCELVCGWGVEVLGVWAEECGRVDGLLEEVVGVWLGCGAVRVVVDLVGLCVARDPHRTVGHVLIGASRSSPLLDWLVAHIGATHPGPVLAQLLDPTVHRSLDPDQLDRITAILSHLAQQHSSVVGQALCGVLERTVGGECWPGAGPQLLLLMSRSAPLLGTLAPALPRLLDGPQTLNRLATTVAAWVPTYFRSWPDLQQLCVQLLVDAAGPALLLTLLHGLVPGPPSHSSPYVPHLLPNVKATLATLLHALLTELCSLSYARRSQKPKVALLASLTQHQPCEPLPILPLVSWSLQSNNKAVIRAMGQLVAMSCSQQQQPGESGLLGHLLHAYPSSAGLLHLAARQLLAIIREQQVGGVNLEGPVSRVLTKHGSGLVHAIGNMQLLLSGPTLRASLSEALMSLLPILAQLINVPKIGPAVVKLLTKLPLSQPVSLAHTSCLAHAITSHFLMALETEDVASKVAMAGHCGKLLTQLSNSSCGNGLVTRLIVEALFTTEWAYLFGAIIYPEKERVSSQLQDKQHLFRTNYTFDSWVKLPESHTTIFHAGVINNSVSNHGRDTSPRQCVPQHEILLNSQLALNILASCSKHHDHSAVTIAFLLVEIIAPDIMYNGFPWPDENIKFTIERDLTIKKIFEDFPMAWDLLELVASNRPALCYCSVLVRALTASLIAVWSTSALSSSTESPKELKATERLLEIMVIGQFLPQNMSVLPQMMSHHAPYEVVAILQDVWNYMRDNTPSPDRWTLLSTGQQDRSTHHADPRAFDTCRRLLHFHIETLGHLLPTMLAQ